MWNKEKLKTALYWAAGIAGVILLAFFGYPALTHAQDWVGDPGDPYFAGHSPWNSGAIDALGGNPTGFDGSADYLIDYTDARDEILHEELLDAIEESSDEQ